MDPPAPPKLDDRTRALLARAERRVAGRDANQEIDRERTRQRIAYGRSLSYEVVMGPQHGFAYLATVVAPKLAEYMRNKKMSAYNCRGVFVSLFVGADLYLIEAPTFFDAVREAEGLDEAGWRVRVAAWERLG
ncbi:MAG TPA: STAUR_1299 family protein [Polyangia bacterium]|nr:STAUR_1299 family protein [Polyangia bacterium]